MNKIPGLTLRVTKEEELQGIDYAYFNEFTHDYVEIQRDLYSDMPKSVPVNNHIAVTPINTRNTLPTQNSIEVIKMKSIIVTKNTW